MIVDQSGKKWWKGNLHTHTTVSDGAKDPQEVLQLYRQAGYDFLALTDHWKPSDTVEEKDFLLLSGCEYNVGESDVRWGVYHLVGIGFTQLPQLTFAPYLEPQTIIDEVHRCGGLVNLAHPAWSLNGPEHILKLSHIDLCEIYNTTSAIPWNVRPYSGYFIDLMAAKGRFLPCIAADDAHHYDGDETKSYIMVQAESLTRDAILDGLRSGKFYATQGPTLQMEKRGKVLHITCSPVQQILCFSDAIWSPHRVKRGTDLTEMDYPIMENLESFVRVEVTDAQGRSAWSSPIPLD